MPYEQTDVCSAARIYSLLRQPAKKSPQSFRVGRDLNGHLAQDFSTSTLQAF